MEAAQAGDEEAFAALVRRVHARVFRWALGRTGDPDDADDVTQSVLIRLHRHLGGYRASGSFDAWLYRITANAAASHAARLKRRRRSRRALSPAVGEGTTGTGAMAGSANPAAGASTAASVADAQATRAVSRIFAGRVSELVRTYFRELPARQREVFDLVDLQGHSPAEVAEMLGLKQVTVRANLFKARRTMRRTILARHPEIEE